MKFEHLRDSVTGLPVEIPDVPVDPNHEYNGLFKDMNPAMQTPEGCRQAARESAQRLMKAFPAEKPADSWGDALPLESPRKE